MPSFSAPPDVLPTAAPTPAPQRLRAGVLGWPVHRRVLVVLPALLALWLAVFWARTPV
ncbi:MAG: hypothetical protein OHK0048_01200 [Rhodoferax sp.]